ncbi:MAG: hypothetical protein CBB87_02815 [Micavibrio sp. TMED27]|nr:hypothetical protein [Micavibrio sp.]OUT92255.1 MAG: hypothetical protein CBB87_02815 [Micavibrio sp. TMED27]|tara:strand:+ start:361 stop:1269 length:909 start_codon:yes stop_codon:yes gene_type:complete
MVNKISFNFLKLSTLTVLTAISLSACADNDQLMRETVAARIASPAWMVDRQVSAGPYAITVYERMHEKGMPANIYIEGDGAIDEPEALNVFNPTPNNPVGLHLASRDNAKNLAYIARPCQFSGLLSDEQECNQEIWANHKEYGRAEIDAYNTLLDKMKARYGVTSFNLIGYDSGATLAALIAADREDVLSLRTVAGEFDNIAIAPYKRQLRNIPQLHLSGAQDTLNTPEHTQSFLQFIGQSACIKNTHIQEAAHFAGWVDKWPEQLKRPLPTCEKSLNDYEFTPYTPEEKPIYYPRMGGLKK